MVGAIYAPLKEAGGMMSAAVQSSGKWNLMVAATGVYQELADLTSRPEPLV